MSEMEEFLDCLEERSFTSITLAKEIIQGSRPLFVAAPQNQDTMYLLSDALNSTTASGKVKVACLELLLVFLDANQDWLLGIEKSLLQLIIKRNCLHILGHPSQPLILLNKILLSECNPRNLNQLTSLSLSQLNDILVPAMHLSSLLRFALSDLHESEINHQVARNHELQMSCLKHLFEVWYYQSDRLDSSSSNQLFDLIWKLMDTSLLAQKMNDKKMMDFIISSLASILNHKSLNNDLVSVPLETCWLGCCTLIAEALLAPNTFSSQLFTLLIVEVYQFHISLNCQFSKYDQATKQLYIKFPIQTSLTYSRLGLALKTKMHSSGQAEFLLKKVLADLMIIVDCIRQTQTINLDLHKQWIFTFEFACGIFKKYLFMGEIVKLKTEIEVETYQSTLFALLLNLLGTVELGSVEFHVEYVERLIFPILRSISSSARNISIIAKMLKKISMDLNNASLPLTLNDDLMKKKKALPGIGQPTTSSIIEAVNTITMTADNCKMEFLDSFLRTLQADPFIAASGLKRTRSSSVSSDSVCVTSSPSTSASLFSDILSMDLLLSLISSLKMIESARPLKLYSSCITTILSLLIDFKGFLLSQQSSFIPISHRDSFSSRRKSDSLSPLRAPSPPLTAPSSSSHLMSRNRIILSKSVQLQETTFAKLQQNQRHHLDPLTRMTNSSTVAGI